jgi:hypothetical protein
MYLLRIIRVSPADHLYSSWIIRVSPAEPQPSGDSREGVLEASLQVPLLIICFSGRSFMYPLRIIAGLGYKLRGNLCNPWTIPVSPAESCP